MKLYNINTDKIEDVQIIPTETATVYVSRIPEAELNSYGYYQIEYTSTPNRRYYDYTEERTVIGDKYVISYTAIDKPIEAVKQAMLADLSSTFKKLAERPKVDTGLGYFIDGGRDDLTNFQIGREFNIPFIKDVNGINHPATTTDYDTVITAIKTKGLELYSQKWAKEAEIEALTTVADCVLYEATPYEAMVDIIDEGTMLPTGEQELKTFYRNNVTEWV